MANTPKTRVIKVLDGAGEHEVWVLDYEIINGTTVLFCRDNVHGESDGFMCYYLCVDGKIIFGGVSKAGVRRAYDLKLSELQDESGSTKPKRTYRTVRK